MKVQQSYGQVKKSHQKEVVALKAENQCLKKIIDEYFKKVEEDKEGTQNNVTLNIQETTTNWSLFNLFNKDKKETKKYKLVFDYPTGSKMKGKTAIENREKTTNMLSKSHNFSLYQGQLLPNTYDPRPSEIRGESRAKKPGTMTQKMAGRAEKNTGFKSVRPSQQVPLIASEEYKKMTRNNPNDILNNNHHRRRSSNRMEKAEKSSLEAMRLAIPSATAKVKKTNLSIVMQNPNSSSGTEGNDSCNISCHSDNINGKNVELTLGVMENKRESIKDKR